MCALCNKRCGGEDADQEPSERVPEFGVAKTRRDILEKGNSKVEELRKRLRGALAFAAEAQADGFGGHEEAEVWLLENALSMRKELQQEVSERSLVLSDQISLVLGGVRDTIIDQENRARGAAERFRAAHQTALIEQADWVENRLQICMEDSLGHVKQGHRILEHAICRRSSELQAGLAVWDEYHHRSAHIRCLHDVTNVTLRLLEGRMDLSMVDLSAQDPKLLSLWDRQGTPWNERMRFVQMVLGSLSERGAGKIAAGAAAHVLSEELVSLRKRLSEMPEGKLLVDS